jgi:hypothetical protein|tara:strand:+ start:24 stop:311 length:288 start_codon:yes stop_codon:yes gene_type:complete
MKDTNAIEKALQSKINVECREIVDKFVADLEKLSNKYGGTMFYDFIADSASDATRFNVQGLHGVTNVLHRMVLKNHSENMLKYKSKELIKKLDLI